MKEDIIKGKILVSLLIAGLFFVPVLSSFGPLQQITQMIYSGPKIVFEERNNHETNMNAVSGNNPKGKPQPPSPGPDKWAVVIGIADYQGSQNDLLYPDDDAQDMYTYLLSQGYFSSHIKLLTNRKATASAIVSSIDWMNTQETQATSECVFFYSGHGTYCDGYNDGDSENRDECIVGYNLYLILDGQLRDKFSTFTSQQIVFIFDCCLSGEINDLRGAYYYMHGLYSYNTAEDAQNIATSLAHNAVQQMYNVQMDPQQYDTFTGTWQF